MKSSMGTSAAIIVAGLGVGYYWFSIRDNTPVGLIITKELESEPLGTDSNDAVISILFAEGSFRENKSSIPVKSVSAEEPMLVVLKDGTPISAEVVTLSEWSEPIGEGYDNTAEGNKKLTDDYNAFVDRVIAIAKANDVSEEQLTVVKMEEPQTAEAESIYGPMMSLQSNFVW